MIALHAVSPLKTCHLLVLLALLLTATPASAMNISTNAQRLFETIDALDVEHRWLSGSLVHWNTGLPRANPAADSGKHTHCSAFVAAAAQRVGVYILRPPAHSSKLLANAQYDWLFSQGAEQGWQPLADALAAQEKANQGFLIVAVYRNHHADRSGHIAIVRPSEKSALSIQEEGPQVTQAGSVNARSMSLQEGFAGHPAAWKKKEVRFFAHAVEMKQFP